MIFTDVRWLLYFWTSIAISTFLRNGCWLGEEMQTWPLVQDFLLINSHRWCAGLLDNHGNPDVLPNHYSYCTRMQQLHQLRGMLHPLRNWVHPYSARAGSSVPRACRKETRSLMACAWPMRSYKTSFKLHSLKSSMVLRLSIALHWTNLRIFEQT